MGIKYRLEDGKGNVLEDYDTRTPEEVTKDAQRPIIAEIQRLEAEVTPRRQREAILGTDNGWLANQEALIASERAKL